MRKAMIGILSFGFFFLCTGCGIISDTSEKLFILTNSIEIDENILVKANEHLLIQAGARVAIKPGINITAFDGGKITIGDLDGDTVFITSTDKEQASGLISISSGEIIIENSDISHTRIEVLYNATAVVDNVFLHDYDYTEPLGSAIFYTLNAQNIIFRNSHLKNYYEVNFISSPAQISNSIFEYMVGDGVDFDNSPLNTVIENCTIRNGFGENIDAIDFGKVMYMDLPLAQGTVQNCLIYNISDKGVSIGEQSAMVLINNCLIHDAGTGIAVKDTAEVIIRNVTIADSVFGLNFYEERPGYRGGRGMLEKSILLNNIENLNILDDGQIELIECFVNDLSLYSSDPQIIIDVDSLEGNETFTEDFLPIPSSSLFDLNWGYENEIGAQ